MRPAPYESMIREALARLGEVGAADPRHIEAYMRLGHPTLDGLDAGFFIFEVGVALECVRADGLENAEACAQSFGL